MAYEYNNDFINVFNKTILDETQMKEIEGYTKEYGDKSEQYLAREIMKIKASVPSNVIDQHIKNLDHLSQMEGFITIEMKQRIDMLKRILNNPSGRSQSNVEGQFFGGSGLLLWFLLLTSIWRKPYYWNPRYRY